MAPADGAARGVVDGSPIRLFNERGEMKARAHLTDKIPGGTVWMRDGWGGLNRLTAGVAAIPDEVQDALTFHLVEDLGQVIDAALRPDGDPGSKSNAKRGQKRPEEAQGHVAPRS